MSEPGLVGEKKKPATQRLPAVAPGDQPYRPSHRPTASERSPYPTRPAEVLYTEEVLSDEEGEVGGLIEGEVVERREVAVAGRKRMAKRSEEVDFGALMNLMMDRYEQWRLREEERRKEYEDLRRKERQEEAERKREEEAARQRLRDEEDARRRDEADTRKRDETYRRRARQEEEEKSRAKRELMQEKLKGLGVYKDGNELGAYLEKFERIMRESKVEEEDWSERLYPRLPERLCVRVAQLRDDGSKYSDVKNVLLKAAGETTITYGNQLFDANSDTFKSMSASSIVEWMQRTVKGTCQGCTNLEEGILAIALALTRRVLPQSGKMF